MFAKPASFKPYAAIKNSERKNVLANIEKQCGLTDNPVEQKQLLLPKTVQAAKAITHGGEKITVYSEDQLPLWVIIRNQYVPTVALMSRLPVDLQLELLPTVYTVPRTLTYLQNGADFMTPGIFGDLPSESVKKGSACQIRDLDSQSVMATGLALIDLSKVTEETTGKCIQTISVVGDKLTPKTKLGSAEGVAVNAKPTAGANAPEPEAKPEVKSVGEGSEALSEAKPESETEKTSAEPTQAMSQLSTHDDELEADEPLSPKEADEAFLYALNKVIRQPKHTYPMPMAMVSTLLNENMPFEHPDLLIKSTTFKKMGKLLKHAEKLGLISCRERPGNEVIILGVNVPQNEAEPEPVVRKSKSTTKPGARMTALLMYRPKPSLREIMDAESRSAELHDAGSLRKQVLGYISKSKLVGSDGVVQVDEPLRKALGLRQTVGTIKREEVGAYAVKQSSPFHKIAAPGQSPDDVAWAKGGLPSVVIKTERRGGNKTVTLVQTAGLTGFHIDPQELADELRHACAGSATISDVKGTLSIVVQGNHVAKIVKVLEKRGLKSAWIKAA